MINIEWTACGGWRQGYATTKSGLRAMVTQVQRTTGVKPLFSVAIEGVPRNVANRATLEKVMQILESR